MAGNWNEECNGYLSLSLKNMYNDRSRLARIYTANQMCIVAQNQEFSSPTVFDPTGSGSCEREAARGDRLEMPELCQPRPAHVLNTNTNTNAPSHPPII